MAHHQQGGPFIRQEQRLAEGLIVPGINPVVAADFADAKPVGDDLRGAKGAGGGA